jgi:flagellar hook-associated protein 3 FlgL
MAAIGSPTLLFHERLSSAVSGLRRQADTARLEVITGRKADLVGALGGRLGAAHLLKKALDDVELGRQATARAALRGGTTQSVLGSIAAGAASLGAGALSAVGRGDNAALSFAAIDARSALEDAVVRLNGAVEGVYLFSGDAVDRPPLASADTLIADIAALYAAAPDAVQYEASLDAYFAPPSGGFFTNVYRGGVGAAPDLDLGDGVKARPSTRADAAEIRDLLRGLATLAVGAGQGQSADRDLRLGAAAGALNAGAQGVTLKRAAIGLEEARIEAARARLDQEEAALTVAYNDETARDPYEAASRLAALEGQLETSYTLTARASRLSLVNFL